MNIHIGAAPALLDAALAYVAEGYPVFPCDWRPKPPDQARYPGEPSKAPLTPRGFKDASVDPEQVQRWWTRWPEALIGLPTGSPSGVFVVDCDIDPETGEAVGEATLAGFGGDLSAVPTATTGSGGAHFFFRWREGLGCTAGKIGPKLDTRGEGGYVVIPPSPGYAFDWLGLLEIGRDLPELPPEIAEALARKPRPEPMGDGLRFGLDAGNSGASRWAQSALADEIGRVAAAPEGERNATLNKAAFALGQIAAAGHLDGARVAAALLAAALGVGLGEAEARATIRSGMTAGAREPRHPPRREDWPRAGSPSTGASTGASTVADVGDAARRELEGLPPLPEPTPFFLRDPALIPPRQWLYGRHLIAGFVSLTVSPGGLGKSSLALVEALAMVTGRPLLGATPPRPLRVWAWNGEDPQEEIERRVAAACMHYGITADALGGRLFTDSGRDLPILIAGAGREGAVVNRPAVEALVEAIRARKIDVLLIDPFVTTHAVPENDNGAVNAVVAAWREIADRTGAAVELIHHAQKAAINAGSELGMAQARGASALIDAVRSARFLLPMTEDEAVAAGLDGPLGMFRVETGKANLAPRPDRATWRRLASVALGNGSGAYPEGDFVGVVEPWAWPDAFDGLDVSDLRLVQAALADGEGRADEQAAAWAGHRVAETLSLDVGGRGGRTKEQIAARQKVKALIAGWIKSGALRREGRHSAKHGRDLQYIVPGDAAEEGRE